MILIWYILCAVLSFSVGNKGTLLSLTSLISNCYSTQNGLELSNVRLFKQVKRLYFPYLFFSHYKQVLLAVCIKSDVVILIKWRLVDLPMQYWGFYIKTVDKWIGKCFSKSLPFSVSRKLFVNFALPSVDCILWTHWFGLHVYPRKIKM